MRLNRGWLVVSVGALMTCVGMGALFSLAVFLQPMALATGWSRAGISSAMTLDFLTMGVAGFGWGALADRFGTRAVVLAGSILLATGLILASRANTLFEFRLLYGVLVGVAAGSFYAPMIAAASSWFEERRSLAVSLVSAGLGVAPMTVSPFARWLISAYDWRTAQMVIGIAAALLLIPAALLVRDPVSAEQSSSVQTTQDDNMTVGRALRSRQFIVLGLTFFACCAAHSGPIFHMVSYAIGCGIAPMAAVSVYSVEGLSGLGGRLLFGVLADRLGAKRVLVAGLLLQAVAIAGYYFISALGQFYTLAVFFGMAYGGVMPLYAVIARESFGPRIMATIFGAATMVSSLGMALGPSIGGWIFDTFRAYGRLYIISFTIGLVAAVIALTFPPSRARALRPQLA